MSTSFGDLDIEIFACNSSKISTPILEVDSGLRVLKDRLAIVLGSSVYNAVSTV